MLDVELQGPERNWHPLEEAALQSGLQALEDELSGAGVDRATMRLKVRGVREGMADVHAELIVDGWPVASADAEDPDLVEALRRALSSMSGSVEEVAHRVAAASPHDRRPVRSPGVGMVLPWRMVEDHLHRYALHAMLERVMDGELPAGHVDPRDIAEGVLAARFEVGPITDAWLVLGELREQVRETLDQQVADAAARAGDLDSSLLQASHDLDDDLDASTERGMLTAALFSLGGQDRGLFAEVVVDGFPLDAVAAARDRDPREVEGDLKRILDLLAQRLGRSVQDTREAYRWLGEVLQAERIEAHLPVSG